MIAISQSMIKSYLSVYEGDMCGLQFEAYYITRTHESKGSEAMDLGAYFEYKATGQLNYYGRVPEVAMMADGITPKAPGRQAELQAENFKTYADEMGIEILETGKRIEKDGYSVLLDMIAMVDGEEAVIDLKYSGAIGDKWNPFGWHLPTLNENQNHRIQAIHYHTMTGLPFYFWVFSSKKDLNSLWIKVDIDPQEVEVWKRELPIYRARLENDIRAGFKALPSLTRCRTCPLFDGCADRVTTPIMETVYFGYSQ